jgi:hypothetical protein
LASFRTKKENSPNANLIAIDVLIAIHFVLLPKKKSVPLIDHHHFGKDFGHQKERGRNLH